MSLSQQNAITLLTEMNRQIEEYAERTVQKMIEEKDYTFIVYPPNGGLSEKEVAELNKLDNNEDLKLALIKVLADNSAGVVYSLLTFIDGISDPSTDPEKWTGVKLVDTEEGETAPAYGSMLNSGIFEHYWDWKEQRGEKPSQLDSER